MPKTIRKDCPDAVEEFGGEAFVEFSAVWTHRELTEWADAESGEKKFEIVKKKIVALCVPAVGSAPIEDVAELTDERLGDVDQRLFMWLEGVLSTIVLEVLDLGKALRSTAFASLAASGSSANRTQ